MARFSVRALHLKSEITRLPATAHHLTTGIATLSTRTCVTEVIARLSDRARYLTDGNAKLSARDPHFNAGVARHNRCEVIWSDFFAGIAKLSDKAHHPTAEIARL